MIALLSDLSTCGLALVGAVLTCVGTVVALTGLGVVGPLRPPDKALTGFLAPPRCDGCGLHVGSEPCPRCGCWWGRP